MSDWNDHTPPDARLKLSACGGAQRRNCGANPNPGNGETPCQETSQ